VVGTLNFKCLSDEVRECKTSVVVSELVLGAVPQLSELSLERIEHVAV
jgi:hypothetical protein